MNKYVEMINVGCSYLSMVLWNIILISVWIIELDTFSRFALSIIGLVFILDSIYTLNTTPYKSINIIKVLGLEKNTEAKNGIKQ